MSTGGSENTLMINLFLRAFVIGDSIESVKKSSKTFISILKDSGSIETAKVNKYWKIQEYFEITFRIKCEGHKFKEILGLLAEKWEMRNGFEAIWNYEDMASSIKETKWMHIEPISK